MVQQGEGIHFGQVPRFRTSRVPEVSSHISFQGLLGMSVFYMTYTRTYLSHRSLSFLVVNRLFAVSIAYSRSEDLNSDHCSVPHLLPCE